MNKEKMILRNANISELSIIWKIFEEAILQRKQDGSDQWQDGYPNKEVISEDIEKGFGYVLTENNIIIAYAAIIFGIEPFYNNIIGGKWLTDGDYAVVHRLAVSGAKKGKGVATHFLKLVEDLCISKKVHSIKIDTNFDNLRMIRVFDKLNYIYCGEVFFIGAYRRAYEKVLSRE